MRSSLMLYLSLLLPALAAGQNLNVPGPANTATVGTELAVSIRSSDGQPLRSGLRVQLLNMAGVPIDETTVRGAGVASFLNLTSGSYSVRVSGGGYETATSNSVEVYKNQRYQNIFVTVTPTSTDSQPQGTGMLDARALRVPPKAKKEMDKGMEAFSHGDSKSAIEHLNQAIKLYPEYEQAYNNLGVVRIVQDDTAGAKEAFEKSVALNDHYAPAYANLARLALERNDLPTADAMLDKTISSDPSLVDGLALQARLRFLQHRFPDALALVARVHAQPHGRFSDVHLMAAEIYRVSNRNQEAIAECEIFLKEDPQNPIAPRIRQTMANLQAKSQ